MSQGQNYCAQLLTIFLLELFNSVRVWLYRLPGRQSLRLWHNRYKTYNNLTAEITGQVSVERSRNNNNRDLLQVTAFSRHTIRELRSAIHVGDEEKYDVFLGNKPQLNGVLWDMLDPINRYKIKSDLITNYRRL